ncbi:hypothetical protein [Moraxella sp. ZY200743]|uniref:hypothetical protein n=1 Tax=Moraxella sp. ZY200743 TaxID=2911970 RepID=UPI003D7E7906
MGVLKKRKTYSDADAQNIFNKEEYRNEQKNARKYAMHQYLADTSGKWSWETDADLMDYLQGADDTQYASRWDKAYKYSTTDKFSHTGESKNTDRDKYTGEYYPLIQLKGGTLDNPKGVTETDELCTILNLNHDDLIKQFQQGYADEWVNLKMCALGMAVEFPDSNMIEKTNEKNKVCYLYRYFENLIHTRKTNICEVANKHIKYRHRFVELSYTVQDTLTGYDDWHIPQGAYWIKYEENITTDTDTTEVCSDEFVEIGAERGRVQRVCRMVTQKYSTYIKSCVIGHHDSQGKYHIIRVPILKLVGNEIHKNADGEYFAVGVHYEGARDIDYRRSKQHGVYSGAMVFGWVVNHGFATNTDTATDLALIPIDRKLISDYSPKEKSNFLRENLYVFHTWQKTVKVYRGWVKPFIKIGAIIVAAVITIKTAGAGGTAAAAIIKAATSLLIGLAVDKLIDFAVKIGFISARTAAIIKVVVAVVTVAQGAGWDFSKILTAPNIMKVINVSFGQYSKLQQKELKDLTKQMNEHNTLHAKRMYDLKQKQKLHLDGFSSVASLYIHTPSFSPTVDLFETVEMMYARHHNYNVVGVSLGLINRLSAGLYTGKPKLYQIQDSSEDLQDMLIIA